jgi:hypothetical protein
MMVVGDGCSDPLNPSMSKSSCSSNVDASDRVSSEIHGPTNNSERELFGASAAHNDD